MLACEMNTLSPITHNKHGKGVKIKCMKLKSKIVIVSKASIAK